MADVSSTSGITSYQDILSLVELSLTKNKESITKLETQKENNTTAQEDWSSIKSSLFSLKMSLLGLRSSSTFYSKLATSSDTDIVTASANSDAAITSYSLTGITLATAASISSSAVLGLDEGDYTYHESTAGIDDGTNVDPNAKLNTASSHIQDYANLTAGTFHINDSAITFDPATDTLYTLLGKINSSAAGVTATFDAATNKVRITSETIGDEEITFSDASNTNVFDVFNIDTENATYTGNNDDWDTHISLVSELSTITDGYFTINGVTFEVDIDEDSLQDIINRINDSAAGVSAFYNEDLDKLVLTSKETGENIAISNDTSNFLDTMKVLDVVGEDQDGDAGESTYVFAPATVTVNGAELTFDGNTFEINGTTFTVHSSTAAGVGANVEVTRDNDRAKAAIQDFITKYNALYSLIESKRGADQPLENDWLLSSIKSNLRSQVIGNISNPGAYNYLREVGIQYDDGKLSLDTDTLDDALRDDPTSISEIFGYDTDTNGLRDDGGFVSNIIDGLIDPASYGYTGGIGQRITSLRDANERLDEDITTLEERMATKKQLLINKYNRFMESIQQMQQQQQWLQQNVWNNY